MGFGRSECPHCTRGDPKCPHCTRGDPCVWFPVHCWHQVSTSSTSPAVGGCEPAGSAGGESSCFSWADTPSFGLGLMFSLADRPLLPPLASLCWQHRRCSQHPLSQTDLAAISSLTREMTMLIVLPSTNPTCAGRELRDPWEALGTSCCDLL